MFDKSNGTIYTISTPEGPKEVALPHFPEMPDKIVCPINQSQFKIIRPNNTADIEFLKEYSQLMIRQTRQTYIAIDTECASRPSEGKPWGPRLASIQFAEFTYDPRTLIFSFGLGIIAYWPTDPIISTLITSIFNRPNVNLYFYDLTSDYTFMEDENIRIDKCQIYDSQTRYLNEYETSFFIHKPTKSLLKAVQDTCSYCPLSVNAYYYMEPLKNRNFGLIHYIRSKLRIYYPLTINDSTHIYAAGDVVLTSIAAMALYRDGVDLKSAQQIINGSSEYSQPEFDFKCQLPTEVDYSDIHRFITKNYNDPNDFVNYLKESFSLHCAKQKILILDPSFPKNSPKFYDSFAQTDLVDAMKNLYRAATIEPTQFLSPWEQYYLKAISLYVSSLLALPFISNKKSQKVLNFFYSKLNPQIQNHNQIFLCQCKPKGVKTNSVFFVNTFGDVTLLQKDGTFKKGKLSLSKQSTIFTDSEKNSTPYSLLDHQGKPLELSHLHYLQLIYISCDIIKNYPIKDCIFIGKMFYNYNGIYLHNIFNTSLSNNNMSSIIPYLANVSIFMDRHIFLLKSAANFFAFHPQTQIIDSFPVKLFHHFFKVTIDSLVDVHITQLQSMFGALDSTSVVEPNFINQMMIDFWDAILSYAPRFPRCIHELLKYLMILSERSGKDKYNFPSQIFFKWYFIPHIEARQSKEAPSPAMYLIKTVLDNVVSKITKETGKNTEMSQYTINANVGQMTDFFDYFMNRAIEPMGDVEMPQMNEYLLGLKKILEFTVDNKKVLMKNKEKNGYEWLFIDDLLYMLNAK
ncbi:hypothetical protein GPJ56_007859 [Histomonas meleagridis]|uniref:uncharacterized protein n=1 Tax=Histomonas meleagridis TaxID=135588 RepID=UPI0035594D7E|nr:hypothetical protein GPJ56_007859 [Histomonas meleagridis]KAH0804079.1 hypothetical protein GO595_002909 [Histomonas meleagridis]